MLFLEKICYAYIPLMGARTIVGKYFRFGDIGHAHVIGACQLPVLEKFSSGTDFYCQVPARKIKSGKFAVADMNSECRTGIYQRGYYIFKSVKPGIFGT